MSFSARAAGIALAAILGAVPVAAQVPGLPVYNQGVPRGFAPLRRSRIPQRRRRRRHIVQRHRPAPGSDWRASRRSCPRYNPDGPAGSKVSVGATGNLRVFGGPLVPLSVTLQGGVGYAKPDDSFLPGGANIKQWRFPVGVGFALTIPNPALSIKPWLAPRVDIVHTSSDFQVRP